MIETSGYLLEFPDIEDDLNTLLPETVRSEPLLINTKNITAVTPGDEYSSLIYTLDGMTIYCNESFRDIADKIREAENVTFLFKN